MKREDVNAFVRMIEMRTGRRAFSAISDFTSEDAPVDVIFADDQEPESATYTVDRTTVSIEKLILREGIPLVTQPFGPYRNPNRNEY